MTWQWGELRSPLRLKTGGGRDWLPDKKWRRMTDWAALARARGLEIPEADLERLAKPLASLEETFRPLLKTLTPLMEPDGELHLEGGE